MLSTASTITSETASMVLDPISSSVALPLTPSALFPEEDGADEPKRNLRFLVKWQNYSHLHNTWETYSYLSRFKGFKRVENYIGGVYRTEQLIRSSPTTSREDLESLAIEKERRAEMLEGYKQVERIISERNAAANNDIDHEHCKWT